jgi:hypothetical protein|tara:strand:+ start:161 stop:349 length:189 start_codon:yes stop_codon:yes gene_type:complete
MAKSSRKSPPPFLKGKPIQNDKYTRIDSVGLAEDAEVLNVIHTDWIDEPIINAQEYLKAKKK